MTVVLGIDPDTTTPAFALLRARGRVQQPEILWCGLATALPAPIENRIPQLSSLAVDLCYGLRAKYTIDVTVVESQRKYPGSRDNAQDLIHLGQVAGICAAASRVNCIGPGLLLMPYPSEWKGNADKKVMQARYLGRVGITDPKVLVKGVGGIPGTETITKASLVSHVADAIGLAWWGLERICPNEIPQVRRYGA